MMMLQKKSQNLPENAGYSSPDVVPGVAVCQIRVRHHNHPFMIPTPFSAMLTQARPLTTIAANKAVKIPAPARSAVVIGFTTSGVLISPLPALGSPLLVP